MRTRTTLVPSLVLAAALAACSEQAPLTATGPAARLDVGTTPSEYLVISSGNSLPMGIEAQVRAIGGTVTGTVPQIGVAVVSSTDPDFRGRAAALSGVRSVVPNVEVQWVKEPTAIEATEADAQVAEEQAATSAAAPADRYFPIQWALKAVHAQEAWQAGYFGQGARVAILDAGMDYNNPDLAPNYDAANSASFVPGEGILPPAGFNHGTHVAGIIAAVPNNIVPSTKTDPGYNGGVVGVAPQATISAVKVLRASGSGSFLWFAKGVVFAADHGAQVINASLGGEFPRNGYIADDGTKVGANDLAELVNLVGRATTYAHDKGVVLVVSAGNSAIDRDHDADYYVLPADLPHVLSIAATAPHGWGLDANASLDDHASYSNYGQSRIDLAAPGGDGYAPLAGSATTPPPICVGRGMTPTYRQYCYYLDFVLSDGPNRTLYFASGTSMAAPMVSGVAALIIGKSGGMMTPAAVEAKLRASADDIGKPGRDDFYGLGRVNAARAVQ